MKDYTRVCIVNNAYVLFQYFLLSSLEDIDKTYFFFTEDIDESVAKRFHHTRLCLPNGKIRKFLFLIWLNFFSDFKWPFLKTCEYWGQDNLLITSPLIKNRKIIIPEDGLLNYTFKPVKRNFKWIRRVLFGNLLAENPLGYSKNVDTIYLTGVKAIPNAIKNKVKIIDFSNFWNESTNQKKEFICDIFSFHQSEIDFFANKENVLFTQPLSEDGIMPETEKILIYRYILSQIPGRVVIKSHPREKTLYKEVFPECDVFSSPIPLELLSLVGVKFKSVYTLFSSAVFNLPYKTDIHWFGSCGNKYLKDRYGDTLDI